MTKNDDQINRREMLKQVAVMTGGAVSASVMLGVMSSTGFAQSADIKDAAFSEAQLNLVGEMAQMIIPDTDTPGAKAAGVHDYIHLIVSEWYYPDEKNNFMMGLGAVDGRSNNAYGKDFLNCSDTERHKLMTDMDNEKSEEKTFFQEFKELTLVGYFTSQIGAEEELRYEAIPGPYEGCIPFERVGRTWAT